MQYVHCRLYDIRYFRYVYFAAFKFVYPDLHTGGDERSDGPVLCSWIVYNNNCLILHSLFQIWLSRGYCTTLLFLSKCDKYVDGYSWDHIELLAWFDSLCMYSYLNISRRLININDRSNIETRRIHLSVVYLVKLCVRMILVSPLTTSCKKWWTK